MSLRKHKGHETPWQLQIPTHAHFLQSHLSSIIILMLLGKLRLEEQQATLDKTEGRAAWSRENVTLPVVSQVFVEQLPLWEVSHFALTPSASRSLQPSLGNNHEEAGHTAGLETDTKKTNTARLRKPCNW